MTALCRRDGEEIMPTGEEGSIRPFGWREKPLPGENDIPFMQAWQCWRGCAICMGMQGGEE